MNVMGFREAYEAASLVRLAKSPLLDVRVPTVPGMALMKIISWRDKYPERSKDAEDLKEVLNQSHTAYAKIIRATSDFPRN